MAQKKPKDYYKILGVSQTATEQEIKSAYRSLARKYHPDVNPDNKVSEQLFKDVREAYDTLSDEKKRQLHDIATGLKQFDNGAAKTAYNAYKKPAQSGTKGQKSKPPGSKAPSGNPTGAKKTDKGPKDVNFSDSFSNLFENIMKNMEMGAKSQPPPKGPPRFTTDAPPEDKEKVNSQDTPKNTKSFSRSDRGEDITLDVYMTMDEAIKGSVRTVNILHTDPCKKCKGEGKFSGIRCHECDGSGEKNTHKKLDVKIPGGIKNGSKVRIAKEGNRGLSEDNPGDLYLNIKIYNPTNFEFTGTDVLSELALAPHEAVLGAEVQVLTIDGFVKMKVPAATQTGQKFRLARQGLPDKSGERGNHFVMVKIEVPKEVSLREKELYEELSKISRFNPREYIE